MFEEKNYEYVYMHNKQQFQMSCYIGRMVSYEQ